MKNDLQFYDLNADCWWNEDAKIYALNYLNPPRFSFFDRYVSQWQGLKVLDVGCGGGFSCEFMAKRGAIVSGIDQSKKCIEKAKIHAKDHDLSIDYTDGVAESLPYESNYFNAVICVDVLEHVADLSKVIAEIHRVLKKGGFFFFDTINKSLKAKIIMIWLLEDILRQIPQGIHDWQKFIKPEELMQIMQQQGFIEVDIKGFNALGETISENIQAYLYYQKHKKLRITISDNTSIMYIGKAVKS